MINQIFIKVVNMSLTASIIIIAVLVVRFLLRRTPKIFAYCLWGVVLFRLLCPISFTAPFSLLGTWNNPPIKQGRMEYIPENIDYLEEPSVNLPINVVSDMINATLPQGEEALVADPLEIAVSIGTWTWIIGLCSLFIYSVASLVRLKNRLKSAIHEEDNIYTIENLSTPFVHGFIRPTIYLPTTLHKEEKEYILLHEQIHIKRGDHIVKLISYFALCIHWFNPLVWLAFILCGQDMEMSCDEAVIRKMGNSVKKEYTSTLLSFASGKRIISGVPLAFGEGDTGKRIKNLLHYKKPTVLVFTVAALFCVLFVVVFAFNPEKKENLSETLYEQNVAKNPSDSLVSEESLSASYYGVVSDLIVDGTVKRVVTIPGIGDVEIPESNTVNTYFEREEQELLLGDMVNIVFPVGETVELQNTDPSSFSTAAESIVVMWSGCDLQYKGEDKYLFSFAKGIIPESENAVVGDKIEIIYQEEGEVPKVLCTVPILAIKEITTEKVPQITVELSSDELQTILSGIGFTIDFTLHKESSVNDQHAMETSIDDWLTITLPGGYTLTDYNAIIGIDGGVLIEPRAYEKAGEWVESGLPEWTATGVISRINHAQDLFVFENNRIKEKYSYWNHTTEEKVEYLEGLDMPAILYHGNHDLYTGAELQKLEEQGIYIDAAETTSDYWYIYFAKEDSDVAYYLSLATNQFTKEQAIAIAKSVHFISE